MKAIIVMVCVAIMTTACASENSTPLAFSQADLQNILETEWQQFASVNKLPNGGIAMQILSPMGDYFISTGMGENMDNSNHFRIASVTKTFTAAAIMLLHQQGKLNIRRSDNSQYTRHQYPIRTIQYSIQRQDHDQDDSHAPCRHL